LRPSLLTGEVMKMTLKMLLASGLRRPGIVYSSSVTERP
jgi:hypothetical protein